MSFPTVKLLRFVTSYDYVVLTCECIFLLQTLWFLSVEVSEMRRERCAYLRSFWNLIDVAIVAVAFASLGFSVYRTVYFGGSAARATIVAAVEANRYVSLDRMAFGQLQYAIAMAVCVFLVWLKVFKYLSFNRTLLQLSQTLSRCAWDLVAFGLMFAIVFVAFAQLGYMLFGTENGDFRTYGDSLMTLLRTVLGDFDYVAIEKANRVLGPIYFVSYIFFVFFVLLNMFLAIINDTYAEVKSQPERGTELRVGEFVRLKVRMVGGCVVAGGRAVWRAVRVKVLGKRSLEKEIAETTVDDRNISDEEEQGDVVRMQDLSAMGRHQNATVATSMPLNGRTSGGLFLRDIFEPVAETHVDGDALRLS